MGSVGERLSCWWWWRSHGGGGGGGVELKMKSSSVRWRLIPWFLLLHALAQVPGSEQRASSVLEDLKNDVALISGSIGTDLEIATYHMQSVVISRYAVTTVTCRIRNPTLDQQEATFTILLPANAFISNLTIEAGGKNYTSIVQEKEEARRTYEKAKSRGQNTAIVHQKERETSRFRVDVSVAEQDEVIFYLSYEELLERRLGVYTHRLNVHPGYPVRDLLLDVTIHETRAISTLNVKKVPGGAEFRTAVSQWREGEKTARIQYDPDPELMPIDGVIHGQLVLHYDVERALDAGDVQIEEGYFVHFFAPNDLQYTPKHITFLIDTSGSMMGSKLSQVKVALRHILGKLNVGDSFNIIHFATSTNRLGVLLNDLDALHKARKFVNSLEAGGGTNIDQALKMALTRYRHPPRVSVPHHNHHQTCTVTGEHIRQKVAVEEDVEALVTNAVRPHIVVLLTDGQPTDGVTQHGSILKNVRDRNKNGAAIYCLGFGSGADMNLLERISLQNRGTARKIYEDVDAADQLKGFYQELSSPILLDVQFSYSGDAVVTDTLSSTHFYNYFQGTELVVTGQTEHMDHEPNRIRANITGQGRNGQFFMGVTDWNTVSPPDHHLLDHLHLAPTPKNFIKRLWAFMKIKDLLTAEKAAKGSHEKAAATKKALKIALEHHFVTPLTSLVVVQPDQESCKDYEEDDEKEEEAQILPKTPKTASSDNTSFIDSLDSQDSVVRPFDPSSIQVRRSGHDDDEDDWDYDIEDLQKVAVYSSGSRATHHSGVSSLISSCLASLPMMLLVSLSLYINSFFHQMRTPSIHLPNK